MVSVTSGRLTRGCMDANANKRMGGYVFLAPVSRCVVFVAFAMGLCLPSPHD